MRRKKGWIVALALIAVAGVVLVNQPVGGPRPVLGAHKTPLRWVAFADAHRKPIINLPGIGLVWPKPLANLPASDRADLIAGFFVGNLTFYQWKRGESIGGYGRTVGMKAMETAIHVPFGSTPDQPLVLSTDRESISVRLPYDAARPAAYLKPQSVYAGPWKVEGTFVTDGRVSTVECKVREGEGAVFWINHGPYGFRIQGTWPFGIQGNFQPNGTFKAVATLRDEATKKTYPLEFHLKP